MSEARAELPALVISSEAFLGRSAPYARRPIQKHFSQKRVAQPVRLSESVFPVKFDLSASSTHWPMMSVSVFGAAYLSASVAD